MRLVSLLKVCAVAGVLAAAPSAFASELPRASETASEVRLETRKLTSWTPRALHGRLKELVVELMPNEVFALVARSFVERRIELQVAQDRAFMVVRISLP